MNLRRCLYLARPGESAALQKIARWTRVFPSLWEILLADAHPAAMDEYCEEHRILYNVAADARRALIRLTLCVKFLRAHPQLDEVAGLDRYLQGAQQHLADLIDAHAPDAMLYACLEESDSLDAFARVAAVSQNRLTQLALSWENLQQAMRANDFDSIETLLGFTAVDLRFTDWKAWAGVFGLALFAHKYFHNAFRQPFEMEYVDYDYDDLGSEDALGGDLYRYKSDGRWGVRELDGDDERIVLKPEWDRVLRAGEVEPSLMWVKRGRCYGLARIAGDHAGRLLIEPDLHEVGNFANGLAIARRGEAMGFLATDGSWRVAPRWNEVSPYSHGRAVVKLRGKFGCIDESGAVIVEPQFDEADDFTSAGVARVRNSSLCGLIRNDGSRAVAQEFTRLEWHDEFSGWMGIEEGATVLLRADGSLWIGAGWDAIEVCEPGETIRVQLGDRVGLLSWDGTTQLVPCQFSVVESLEPHIVAGQVLHMPDLVRVVLVPGETAPRVGVWSMSEQRFVVPCSYDYVWMTLFDGAGGYGFVVGNRNAKRGESAKGRYRVGMLRADGSTLVEQVYLWIGEPTALNKADARDEIRDTIHFRWSRGEAVPAALKNAGPLIWLDASGSSRPAGGIPFYE